MTDAMKTAARRLERALCNFCNGAADEYEPNLWREEIKRAFAELWGAYNEAYSAGLLTPDAWPETVSLGTYNMDVWGQHPVEDDDD